jgi:hypothetical protein
MIPTHCGIHRGSNGGIHKHFPDQQGCFAKERAAHPISRVDMQHARQGASTQAYSSRLAQFSGQVVRGRV